MVLLDTCALLWLVLDPTRLSARAAQILGDPGQVLHISAISAFEIGTLYSKKRISLSSTPEDWISAAIVDYSLRVIPVSWEDCSPINAVAGDPY
jgi:PIN domain nuclease of toxin-antitoxin system